MYSGGVLGKLDTWTSIVGTLIMVFIAYKFYTAKAENTCQKTQHSAIKAIAVGASLTFCAPQRILLYLGVFAGFGVHYTSVSLHTQWPLILGAFLGSMIWWVIFVLLTSLFRDAMTPERLQKLNKFGAILLVIVAVVTIVPVIQAWV
jgi:threonine/homoserine/homoserine lactone efflux protein